jgi:hypothetical protein
VSNHVGISPRLYLRVENNVISSSSVSVVYFRNPRRLRSRTVYVDTNNYLGDKIKKNETDGEYGTCKGGISC